MIETQRKDDMKKKVTRTEKPFFSVIIPTLNEEKYLPKLLQALTKQTYRNFETIVVDGHSDDKTVEKAKSFVNKLPKLKILISDRRNLSHQRNLGAAEAEADYFVFFDADVDLPVTFLQKVHAHLLREKIQFITTWLNPDTKQTSGKVITAMYNVTIEIEKLIGKPYVHGCNTIMHRDVFFRVGGYDELLTVSEDQEFALRASKKGVKLTILKSPKVIFSLRRFRSEGVFSVVRKQMQANIHMMVKGRITKKLFSYEMGGHVHDRIHQNKVGNYVRSIERGQKKLLRSVVQKAKAISKSSFYA
ncbi:MAG: glycosyltransferase [bacterium]|nr:glycosyltransferase [bacterium]